MSDLERRVKRIESVNARTPKPSPELLQIEEAARRMEVEELRHMVRWHQMESAGKALTSIEQRMRTFILRKAEYPSAGPVLTSEEAHELAKLMKDYFDAEFEHIRTAYPDSRLNWHLFMWNDNYARART
jgi:hypothetical protein